jgi:hypothetical protein
MQKTLGLVVCCLLAGRVAQAQEAGQDPRVGEAKAACVAGDVQKGVRLLAELYMASSDPIWIFNQGRCYHQNAQPVLALSRFREFLRKGQGALDEDIRDAKKYIAEIEAEQQREQPTTGSSAVATTTPPIVSRQSQAIPPEPGRGLRYAGIGIGIFGGVCLATGVVFSLLVKQTSNDVENQTKTDVVVASAVSGKLSDGRRYETLQWISYGVGAAAIAAGSVLYWIGTTSTPTEPRLTSAYVFPVFMANGAGAGLHMAF